MRLLDGWNDRAQYEGIGQAHAQQRLPNYARHEPFHVHGHIR